MRPNYLAGIIIGGLLLYVGIFGSAGFAGLLSLTGDTMKEDFDNLNLWNQHTGTGIIEISPAGQLHELSTALKPPGPDYTGSACRGTSFYMSNAQFTVEWKMILDKTGDSTLGSSMVQIYFGSYWFIVSMHGSTLIVNGIAKTAPLSTASWQVYTACFDTGTMKYEFWQGTNSLFQGTINTGGTQQAIWIDTHSLAEVHVDYFYVDKGWKVPSTTVGDAGNIDVYCVSDNNPVPSLTVSISGTEAKTATTSSTGHAVFSGVKLGQYTVTASYNGKSPTATVTVTKDQTVSTTLDFSTTPVNKASLTVTASDKNGNSIGAAVEVKLGTVVKTGITPYTWNDLEPGTYTVKVSYNGKDQTFTKTISTSSPGTVTASFDETVIDPWAQIRAFIIQTLDNSSFRTLCMVVGGLTALVSVLMFVWPEKRGSAPSPPPRPYGY